MNKLALLDVEELVSILGYEYKISNGNSGVQLNLRNCPACGRSDYKVYLNAETGLGNCFRCDEVFNKFKLIQLTLGISNAKDVFRYIDGLHVETNYRPKPQVVDYKLNQDWVLPINQKIEDESALPDYLKNRNIDAKICKRFDLRLCNYGFYEYIDFDKKKHYVDFSNRILIPIKDIDGNLVTFQGRDISGTSKKKYLFPNMLPGTARFIYNADYALKNKAKTVVLNEGCFDVFATTMALESDVAYKDWVVCGTFGKHLSIGLHNAEVEDQLSDLSRLAKAGVEEFVLLWDGEDEAIAASMETALVLNGLGFNTTVAKLSGDKDPAEVEAREIFAALEARKKPTKLDLVRLRLKK